MEARLKGGGGKAALQGGAQCGGNDFGCALRRAVSRLWACNRSAGTNKPKHPPTVDCASVAVLTSAVCTTFMNECILLFLAKVCLICRDLFNDNRPSCANNRSVHNTVDFGTNRGMDPYVESMLQKDFNALLQVITYVPRD